MVLRRIAPPEARSLVVFGTGPQARAHVQSVCSVRRIESIKLVGRRPAAVDALCRELEREGVSVAAGRADDVAGADIVVCATSSATPVFDGGRLGEQVAVVAVGSHTPEARELDDTTFRRARVVIVEHRATALREAGDVIQALAARALDLDRVLDLGQLTDPELSPAPGISVYKSVGLAYQDLAVATAALDRPVH
jgi:ornithine cyclodeaminase